MSSEPRVKLTPPTASTLPLVFQDRRWWSVSVCGGEEGKQRWWVHLDGEASVDENGLSVRFVAQHVHAAVGEGDSESGSIHVN